MKKISLYIVLIAFMFSAQVHAATCKVDYFELQEVEVRQPAKGLDDAGTAVVSEVITTLVTFGAGKIASAGLKGTAAGVKVANSKAFVLSKKLRSNEVLNKALGQAVANAVEDTALEDWADPVGYLIGELDDIFRTPDDLIVRIGGQRVFSGGEYIFEMPAFVEPFVPIDTKSFTQQASVGSFVGSFNLQLIEYDGFSANDDLGTIYGRDQNMLTDQLPPLNEEDVELFSSAEDDSHYRVKFKIIPGAGTLDDVPERLFCNTDECQDAREAFPNDVYLDGYPSGSDLKACPDGYTDAGETYLGEASYAGTGPWYRVCELHTPNCGRPFTRLKDLGGVSALNDGDVIVLRGRTGHQVSEVVNPDFCDNLTDTCEPRTFSKYLSNSKNNGQYLGVCNDCNPAILNLQNAGAYFMDRDRVDAQWTVKKIGSKYALQGSNGKYLARCLNCTDNGYYDAFVHVVDPDTPLAQFTIEESPTPEGDFIYTLKSDDIGLYLDVCLGCRDDYKLGYGYSGSFNTPDPNSFFAKWSIGVKQKDYDTDGDLVVDIDDAFPNDPTETRDSDGDGVGDNADAFPFNPGENADSDGDGVPNNADACPNDPLDTIDSDGDGVCDNEDAFPDNLNESADADGDGVGNNSDRFPLDPTETRDRDADGVGDNADPFPYDSDNLRHIEVDNRNGWVIDYAGFSEPFSSPTPVEVVKQDSPVYFTLTGGVSGSTAKVTFTYENPLDAEVVMFKILCSELNCVANGIAPEDSFYITNSSVIIDGNKITVIFQDGEIGDDDGIANGVIDSLSLLAPWVPVLLSDGLPVIGYDFPRDLDNDGVIDDADAYPFDPDNTRSINFDNSNGWTPKKAVFVPIGSISEPPPAGSELTRGLVDMTLISAFVGTEATFIITYPEPLDTGMVWWKYGPTAENNEPHWYVFDGAVFSGNTVTLTIKDGGTGDDDLIENGSIIDPGGPGSPIDPTDSTDSTDSDTTQTTASSVDSGGSISIWYWFVLMLTVMASRTQTRLRIKSSFNA